jgi:glycosyltransferase involved in cell wall biosynthesis
VNFFIISNVNADFRKLWKLKLQLPNSFLVDVSKNSQNFTNINFSELNIKNIFNKIRGCFNLKKFISNNKPNRIIFENADFAFLFVITLLWFSKNKPEITFTIHDQEPHPGIKFLFVYAYNLIVLLVSDYIVLYSEPRGIFKLKNTKCRVFKLGGYENTDTELKPNDLKKPTFTNKINFLLIGRGDKYKGLHLLPLLIQNNLKAKPFFSITIAGKNVKKFIPKQVKEFKEVIIIDDYLSNSEMNKLISSTDVGLMLHTEVTQSGLPYEFFKLGKPVIALFNENLKKQFDCSYLKMIHSKEFPLIINFAKDLLIQYSQNEIIQYYNDNFSSTKYLEQFFEYN